jgi:putative ABC transport system permease protein
VVKALNIMLWRDLWHLRGQALAAVVVLMCGVASFVSMHSTYHSLALSRAYFYNRYAFADVFVGLKRAPESLGNRIRTIPGVTRIETRIVQEVVLDVPGLPEPATGRLVSIPARGQPTLNRLCVRQGRYLDPGQADEVIVSEAFAAANRLAPVSVRF